MKDINATIIIGIKGKSEEDIFQAVEHSRRKNVQKAIRSGLVLSEEYSPQDLEEAYKIYSQVWLDGGVSPLPLEEWKIRLSSSDYKLFILKKDKIIGWAVIKFIDRKFYDKNSESNERGIRFDAFASDKEFNDFRPNDFLYWNAILYALRNNLDFVDLGGYQISAKGHLEGVNRFKSQWGGEIVNYYKEYSLVRVIGRKLVRKFRLLAWLNNTLKKWKS